MWDQDHSPAGSRVPRVPADMTAPGVQSSDSTEGHWTSQSTGDVSTQEGQKDPQGRVWCVFYLNVGGWAASEP